MTWLALVAVSWLLVCWSAWGCYALRDFAYARLEERCRRLGRPARFSQILKQQEMALLALELVLILAVIAYSISACVLVGWFHDGAERDLLERIVQSIGLLVAIIVGAVQLPWAISRIGSEAFLDVNWPVISSWIFLTQPLLRAGVAFAATLRQFFGMEESDADGVNDIGDEIRSVVDEGQREGVLESDAGEMIHGVMELQNEDVGAIMTPRTEMYSLPVDLPLDEARQRLVESGHSRVPVIGDTTDDIIGILYAKDLLRALAPPKDHEPFPVLRNVVREPLYVPVTTEIPKLLELMKRERVQMAIVLDEYGGVAGLVTMEDILEEIVGEISDEYDDQKRPADAAVKVISPDAIEAGGRARLSELDEQFSFGFPEDGEADTLAGFVFSQFGKLPTVGESVVWQNLRLTVLAADRRKITRVRIDRTSPEESRSPAQML